jgi:hypothetical protein
MNGDDLDNFFLEGGDELMNSEDVILTISQGVFKLEPALC